MLLDSGASINQSDYSNQNALNYAVRGNDEKVCKLMCLSGVDTSAKQKITNMQPIEYSIKTVHTPFSHEKYKQASYVIESKNIIRAEDPRALADSAEPKTKEQSIHAIIRRCEASTLSDIESDREEQGEIRTKKKKGKKGKKGKGKKGGKKSAGKKGKKGGKKKKK
jgi:hypothetical protein